MTVETFDFTDQAVSVTAAAAEHFSNALKPKGLSGVRISVKDSGCTGFKYVLDEVSDGEESDVSIALDNGINIYVAADALSVIRGTQIDYTLEGVNRTLKFNNPNVVAECGCGESFNVE